MNTSLPRLLLFAPALLSFGSCALPHGPHHGMPDFSAVSFGMVSGLHHENARTGFHLAAFNAGSSRIGSYASVRFDTVAGLDLLADKAKDDDNDDNDLRYDNYQGAFVYNMGVLFRPLDAVGIYAGLGIGNFYDRQIRRRGNRDRAVLRTLYWQENFQTGVIWMIDNQIGVDFGYETFDESWHLAVVSNL
ncbi:MAG: hypothetical protein GY747_09100 [Planctomycetes bacterium]|nr:hypothetical protein [Planctomycetota bacterium]MCP4770425.1 hypothetical protein [Planctomycetota bacterium]MCP4862234.1 hypothetical protein [Planctomycetota bacterium]